MLVGGNSPSASSCKGSKKLPLEINERIASLLSVRMLNDIALVTKGMNKLAKCNSMWEAHLCFLDCPAKSGQSVRPYQIVNSLQQALLSGTWQVTASGQHFICQWQTKRTTTTLRTTTITTTLSVVMVALILLPSPFYGVGRHWDKKAD